MHFYNNNSIIYYTKSRDVSWIIYLFQQLHTILLVLPMLLLTIHYHHLLKDHIIAINNNSVLLTNRHLTLYHFGRTMSSANVKYNILQRDYEAGSTITRGSARGILLSITWTDHKALSHICYAGPPLLHQDKERRCGCGSNTFWKTRSSRKDSQQKLKSINKV